MCLSTLSGLGAPGLVITGELHHSRSLTYATRGSQSTRKECIAQVDEMTPSPGFAARGHRHLRLGS
jgi:hypothetical protein